MKWLKLLSKRKTAFLPERVGGASVGAVGEDYASRELAKKGYRLVERNWRCRAGEIDLVFVDGGELVFVEVKTRLSSRMARKYVFESITRKKRRKLKQLVEIYLMLNFGPYPRPPVRLDAVGVILSRPDLRLEELRHIRACLCEDP